MQRGDIALADLEPVVGSEANKRRPVVIVSNDGANERATMLGRGIVAAVPVTGNVRSVLPFQVLLPAAETGLDRDSKVQAEQVRSIDVSRLGAPLGRVPADLMLQLDEALRLHLAL
jgi:mRNA interferase MazF